MHPFPDYGFLRQAVKQSVEGAFLFFHQRKNFDREEKPVAHEYLLRRKPPGSGVGIIGGRAEVAVYLAPVFGGKRVEEHRRVISDGDITPIFKLPEAADGKQFIVARLPRCGRICRELCARDSAAQHGITALLGAELHKHVIHN